MNWKLVFVYISPWRREASWCMQGPENLSGHQQKCDQQQYLSHTGSCVFSYLTSSLTKLEQGRAIADLSPSEKH